MLYIPLHINGHMVSEVTAQRVEHRDVSNQEAREAIKDTVNTYEIRRDGLPMGTVQHRYGDKAPRLAVLALSLIADLDSCDCGHAGLALMFHFDCPAAKTWRERGSR